MPVVAKAEDVYYSFPDGWDALAGVSLTINSGDYLALIGPNGSGKTTLAKHLIGLLKPSSGRVIVAGLDTRATDTATLARSVGYVFQNPDHQIFSSTVKEELAFGPQVQGLPPETVQERVEAELRAFRLVEVAERPPAVLSPGLRRRVAVASVLTTNPALLILDEPSVGLDAQEQEDLFERIASYNQSGNAVVLITHDMHLVASRARSCLLLSKGRVIADGTPAKVLYNTQALERAGMKPPSLVTLAQALADLEMPQGLTTAKEFATSCLNLRQGRNR